MEKVGGDSDYIKAPVVMILRRDLDNKNKMIISRNITSKGSLQDCEWLEEENCTCEP